MISIINAGIKTMLGDGSAGNPYQIRTEKQLYDLAVCVNAGNDCTNQYYIQTAHITLSGAWTPIGNHDLKRFAGDYNGNGLTISGLSISQIGLNTYFGLFGYTTGNISNLSVSGAVTCRNGAGIVGRALSGTVSGCINLVAVTGTGIGTSTGAVGGVVGTSFVAVSDCINGGTIVQTSNSSGNAYTGGIVGSQSTGGNMLRNLNYGAVSSTTGKSVNAILGAQLGGTTQTNQYYDSDTSLATSRFTARTTADCQGTDALTNESKLNGLGTTNWFARSGDYPLPIRFNK